MSEPICTCDFVGDPKCKAHYRSERTYTESELAAERAALLREAAAELIRQADKLRNEVPEAMGVGWDVIPEWHRAILAIPTDQSALARVEAAAYERGKLDAARVAIKPRVYDVMIGGIKRPDFADDIEADILALQDRGREADAGAPASDVQGKPEERR